MSHKSVRDLFKDVSNSIADNIQFTYARKSDFNALKDKRYPFIQLDPLTRSLEFVSYTGTSHWPVALSFFEKDDPQGAEQQTQDILDQTSDLVDKWIRKLNLIQLEEDTTIAISTSNTVIGTVTISSFVKVTTDCLTGWTVEFDFETPDDFDYCSVYE